MMHINQSNKTEETKISHTHTKTNPIYITLKGVFVDDNGTFGIDITQRTHTHGLKKLSNFFFLVFYYSQSMNE